MTTLTVEGMKCEGCEQTVEDTLTDVPDVDTVSVDRTTETATVEGDADSDELVAAVEEIEYTVSA